MGRRLWDKGLGDGAVLAIFGQTAILTLTGNRGTGTYCVRERLIAPSEALRMSMARESAPLMLLLADRNEISQMT